MDGEQNKICFQKRISLWLSNRGVFFRVIVVTLISFLFLLAFFQISPIREVDSNDLIDTTNETIGIPETARLIVEGNRDFLVFYIVLLFTCVMGIIELLPELNEFHCKKTDLKVILTLMYLILVAGILFSTYQCWHVYRISYELTYSGKLGQELKRFATDNPSIIDDWETKCHFLTDTRWELLFLTSILTFFIILYLAKLRWLCIEKAEE